MFKKMFKKLREQFMPVEDNNVFFAFDGSICILQKEDILVSINSENELVEYPKDLCMDITGFRISKPVSSLQAGDIIKIKESYYKVISVNGTAAIKCISFTGTVQNKILMKDLIISQPFVSVVINLGQNFVKNENGNNFFGGDMMNNPLLMMAMMKDGEGEGMSSMVETMMMMEMMKNSGKNGMNLANNPLLMMTMMRSGKEGGTSSMNDLLMLQLMGGGNTFFGNGNSQPSSIPSPSTTTKRGRGGRKKSQEIEEDGKGDGSSEE